MKNSVLFQTQTRFSTTKPKKIVIIGGVAGGATAAARARRLNEHAEIVIYERGGDISFANCGIPYYLGGEIKSRNKLALHTPQTIKNLLNIKAQIYKEVTKIDREKKIIQVIDIKSGEKFEDSYDKLIISTGAAPRLPQLEGINHPNILTLRNLNDMDKINEKIKKSKSVIVLGAGFIGLEMIEALVRRGIEKVTLVEFKDHVLPILDPEMTTPILSELQLNGVNVYLSYKITKFDQSENNNDEIIAYLSPSQNNNQNNNDGELKLKADLVILSAGVIAESKIASDAKIEVLANKTIPVNEYMQTSDPDIYAVGDVVSSVDKLFNGPSWVPLAGPANRQGRIAAEHILSAFNNNNDDNNDRSNNNNNNGDQMDQKGDLYEKYKGNLGTSIVRVFDIVAGSTGFTEQTLNQLNIPFESIIITGYNHATYYPNSTPILMKIIWEKSTRRILGAQVNGFDGVDKRIDVLSTAIYGGLLVDDLAHLELSYSPPFGSARDVINTAGFAAQNMKNNIYIPSFSLPKFCYNNNDNNINHNNNINNINLNSNNLNGEDKGDDRFVLDVREKEVAALHPLANAVNIPFSQLRDRLNELPRDKMILTVCSMGKTSYFASCVLNQSGFSSQSLVGGLSLHLPQTLHHPHHKNNSNNNNNNINNINKNLNEGVEKKGEEEEVELDVCGIACPGPIMAIRKKIPELNSNQILVVKSSDKGFLNDFPAFCRVNNLQYIDLQKSKGIITGRLRKLPSNNNNNNNNNNDNNINNVNTSISHSNNLNNNNEMKGEVTKTNDMAIVVFSGDLDKVLAALIIANGTVAMGGSATLFFTFWGLNALRTSHHKPSSSSSKDDQDHSHHKSFLEKAMGAMMPQGADHLPLSQMNFGGIGTALMKQTMQKKNLPNLPQLLQEARDSKKVRFVACTMSMDALAISADDLVDYCEFGGVADFLAASSSAKTLFI